MYHCPLPISAFIAAVVESKSACPVLPLVSAQSDRPRRFNFFVIASPFTGNHFERSIMSSVCVYTKALSNTHLCQTQRPSTSHPRPPTMLPTHNDIMLPAAQSPHALDSMMNYFERSIMQSVSIYSNASAHVVWTPEAWNGAVGGPKMPEPARKVFDEERSTLAGSEPAASEVDVTCICDVSFRSLVGQHWPANFSTAHAETILDVDHYAQQRQEPARLARGATAPSCPGARVCGDGERADTLDTIPAPLLNRTEVLEVKDLNLRDRGLKYDLPHHTLNSLSPANNKLALDARGLLDLNRRDVGDVWDLPRRALNSLSSANNKLALDARGLLELSRSDVGDV
ncbi:hypothetical protein C8F04DRAFT_1253954 [Mycena alexandri]|uniref:Uncharacterized protein n=1 Tax=Mycena alexandri TaxID=1745969 RepID=A0AAD6T7J3_9AGAR|nr:hypothetical protein C8F04DRAFT_1253954 [Mycena alexandri]